MNDMPGDDFAPPLPPPPPPAFPPLPHAHQREDEPGNGTGDTNDEELAGHPALPPLPSDFLTLPPPPPPVLPPLIEADAGLEAPQPSLPAPAPDFPPPPDFPALQLPAPPEVIEEPHALPPPPLFLPLPPLPGEPIGEENVHLLELPEAPVFPDADMPVTSETSSEPAWLLPPPPSSPEPLPPDPDLPSLPVPAPPPELEVEPLPFFPVAEPAFPTEHPDAAYMPKPEFFAPPPPQFSPDTLPAVPAPSSFPPPPIAPAQEINVLDALLPEVPPPTPALPPPPPQFDADAGDVDTQGHSATDDVPHSLPSSPGFLPPAAYADTESETGTGRKKRFGNRTLNYTRNDASYLGGTGTASRTSPSRGRGSNAIDEDDEVLDLSGQSEATGADNIGEAGASLKEGVRGKGAGSKQAAPRKRRPIFSWFSLVMLYGLLAAYIGASGPMFRVTSLMIDAPSGVVLEREDDIDGILTTPVAQENVELIFAPLILSTEYITFARKPLVDYVDWWAAYPDALPIPGKPGFVKSPYAKFEGPVDVTGMPAGAKVHCPFTNKIFLIPKQ